MLRSLCLALLAALAVAAPAQAASWLEPASPFGDAPAREGDADVAMAPDGTIVVARFAPDGTLEVRERPPGGPFGAPAIVPVPDEPRDPPGLEVLAGDYGTVAVLFDAGGERYASLRPPRGTWSDPQVVGAAGADPGQAAVAPDGVLWAVGEDPADPRALTVAQLAADGDETFTPLPAPPAGARDVAAALDVPFLGRAHVAYLEASSSGATATQGCTRTTAVLATDVPARGAASPPDTLGTFRASAPADSCAIDRGELVRGLLLAAGYDGGDTVVYSVLSLDTDVVTPLARYRERGDAWPDGPAEVVSDEDVVAERLIGGRGAPAVVVRSGAGKALTTRGEDGSWTEPAPLGGFDSYDAARLGSGAIALAGIADGQAVGRLPGGPAPLGPADSLLGVASDQAGDAAALYSEPAGGGFRLRLAGYDGAGPRITALAVPRTGFTGEGLPFSVEGFDIWSGPAGAAGWDFGDGTRERGVAQGHGFARPGRYTVGVSLEDAAGNATTATQAVTVTDPPLAVPPLPRRRADGHAPRLTGLRVSPRRPRAGRPLALRLRTDEPAQLSLVLASRARHGSRGESLVRHLARRTRRVALPRLAAGTWRLTLVATDAAGNHTRPLRLRFAVRPAARPRP